MAMELRGPTAVRTAIRDHLRVQLPLHMEAARAAWGRTAEQLPLPASVPGDPKQDAYYDREPVAIDRWPLVAVVSGRFTQTATDHDFDGETIYRSVCPVQVYSWVRAEGVGATVDLRDDYAALLRVVLLSHLNLGSSGALRLLERSVVTDFSDVVAVKGERFVAGSYVQFDVQVEETLTERLAMPGRAERDTVTHVSAVASSLTIPSANEEGP